MESFLTESLLEMQRIKTCCDTITRRLTEGGCLKSSVKFCC